MYYLINTDSFTKILAARTTSAAQSKSQAFWKAFHEDHSGRSYVNTAWYYVTPTQVISCETNGYGVIVKGMVAGMTPREFRKSL